MHVALGPWFKLDLEYGPINPNMLLLFLVSLRSFVILVCVVAATLLVILPEQPTIPVVLYLEQLSMVLLHQLCQLVHLSALIDDVVPLLARV